MASSAEMTLFFFIARSLRHPPLSISVGRIYPADFGGVEVLLARTSVKAGPPLRKSAAGAVAVRFAYVAVHLSLASALPG
jgi:hypothetical protein